MALTAQPSRVQPCLTHSLGSGRFAFRPMSTHSISIDCVTWYEGEIRAQLAPGDDADGAPQLGFLIFSRDGEYTASASPSGGWTRQLDYLSVDGKPYTCRIEEGKLRHYEGFLVDGKPPATFWDKPVPPGAGLGAIHYRTWGFPRGKRGDMVVSVFTGDAFDTDASAAQPGATRPPPPNRGSCTRCDCPKYLGSDSHLGMCMCHHYNSWHVPD